jgi:KDO2-lipid IV(A) lauroyltransferase
VRSIHAVLSCRLRRSIVNLRLISQWLSYVLIRSAINVVYILPLFVCSAGARLLSYVCFDLLRIRRRVTDENLRGSFPEWTAQKRSQVGRDMWHHFFLMACESIQAQRRITETNWKEFISYDPQNMRFLDEHFGGDRGCLLLGCHFGNFEIASTFARFGYPRYSIARPLANPFLDRYLTKLREDAGQKMLPKKDIASTVAEYLAEGHNVAVLGDQYGGPKGCRVNFFGRPASYHKSIALFALTARVPIVAGYFRRAGKPFRFEMKVSGVLDPDDPSRASADVRSVTQWYNDLFEEMIREAPEQYWWLHRRWKESPSRRRNGSPTT